ncbi:hypothetical protein BH10BAC3_BH10BAC3_29260 [soil metagenome]
MKNICVAVCLLFSVSAFAQKVNQCGFKIPPKSLASNFASVYEAKNIVDGMLTNIKWQENFQLREQYGINNAYATIIQNKRFIIYDNDFLEALDSYAGTDWASISVLAHEMGHHYYNHVISSSGSTPPKEIEADYFSGYVMARMGANIEQAEAAMNKLGTEYASASHPAKTDRLNAISKGWNYGNNMAPQQGNSVPNTNPNPNTNPTPNTNPKPNTTPTPNYPGNNDNRPSTNNNDNDPASWIYLNHGNKEDIEVELSDDGSRFEKVVLKAGEPFVFKYEVYNYGWLRLSQLRGAKTYRLYHSRDYTIQWSRKQQSWVVVEVP